MSKFVPVEEAETAIARANGATALTATPAPVANGLPPSGDHSAIQVGIALSLMLGSCLLTSRTHNRCPITPQICSGYRLRYMAAKWRGGIAAQ